MATQGCPCGLLGHPRKPCKCTPRQVQVYRARLSGPLLDRIDMHVEVPAVTARELLYTHRLRKRAPSGIVASSGRSVSSYPSPPSGDDSTTIRHRVKNARAIQHRRFVGRPQVRANADMGLADLDVFCRLDLASTALIQKAMESFSLSARAAHRCLRVARTIADLAAADDVQLDHVAEAVQYQAGERGGG